MTSRYRLSPLLACLLAACSADDLVLPDQTEPARIEAASGVDQAGAVGTMLANPLVVVVTDAKGRPVADRGVVFELASNAEGGAVNPDTAVTDAAGRADARWVLGGATGTQWVNVELVGNASLSTTFKATAGTGIAASMEMVSGDEQTAIAGSALSQPLIVRTLDVNGRPVAGVAVAWSAEGGSVSSERTVTGPEGTTSVGRTLGPSAGSQRTVASVSAIVGSPVTFTSTAAAGNAGRLRIIVQPASSAQSGVPLTRQPRVQLVDGNDNVVERSGLAVTAEIASGPPGAVLLGSATASTNEGGIAVFANLAISGASGTYGLNFTGASVAGVISEEIVIGAGQPSGLRVTTQPPTTAESGAPLSRQPKIRLVDQAGNHVSEAGVPVTAGISTGTGTLGGTVTVVTDGSGTASFTNLSLSGSGGSHTLIFASGGLASVTSDAVSLRANAVSPARSSISAPATAAAGATVTVRVTVRNDAGAVVPNTSVSLAATGSGNTISPSNVTTSGSGEATFTFRATAVGVRSLSASVGSVTIGPVQLEVVPGPAVASRSTAEVPEGRRFRETLIVVQARDQFDNPVRSGGANVDGDIEDGDNEGFRISVSDRGDGIYHLTYTPIRDGEDEIEITVNGDEIPGSPFESRVRR